MKKRIAVMILGPLGDVINTSGVFKQLRKHNPNAEISIITINRGLPAIKGIPEIDCVYNFDKKLKPKYLNSFKFALSMRGKFDTVIVLDNSLRSAIIAFLTGAKRRIGRGRELRELFLTDIVPYLPEERTMKIPVCEHYIRCLKPLGIYEPNIETCFYFSDEDKNVVLDLLKKENLDNKNLIGICPACHEKSKNISIDDFAAIVKRINKETTYKPIIVGGGDITELVSQLKNYENLEYYDFTGKTSFTQSAALIDNCSKFISVDTSCMHLAFARKIPTVAIFFSNLAKKWGPKDLSKNALFVNKEEQKVDIDFVIEKLKLLPEKVSL